ncbi:DUF982 domain-containing protein, partial [Mesorhizobium sp. BHbdii]
MTNHLPVRLKFADGRLMTVSSICEASAAFDQQWRDKDAAEFKLARDLILGAMAGTYRPAVAFAAFKKAAARQGMLQNSV